MISADQAAARPAFQRREPHRPAAGAAERSIAAFEKIHGLKVTVHDLTGSLSPFLRPDRLHHRSPLCVAVKAQGLHKACLQFEIEHLRRDLAGLPAGRIHVCHAGLVEWVVPILQHDRLCWVIFAGPRFPGKNLSSAVRPGALSSAKPPWGRVADLSSDVEEEEALLIMEHLRQLAAWLQLWVEEAKPIRPAKGKLAPGSAPNPSAMREAAVLRFIDENYAGPATLAMLARRLRLSESRASHVVRTCCNSSFRDLLIQKRLRVAMELLHQSGLSVSEVASASGFENVAHFHRLFRRRVGHTPARHRIDGRS